MAWTVRSLDEDEWRTLRTVRLEALTDAPEAFWATLDSEAAYAEEDWRSLLRRATWFVAAESGGPVGIAGYVPGVGAEEEPELIGLWVAPTARRRGIGSALVHAVEHCAVMSGAPRLALWVCTDNDGARRLYESSGYSPSGRQERIPHAPERTEVRLHRTLPPQALTRVVVREGRQETFAALSEMPGSDLTTMLLETIRSRAGRRRPVDVLRQYRTDRFVSPGSIPFGLVRAAENAVLAGLGERFDVVTLSPVAPLGTHSTVAGVDQNNVVSTVRQTEVAADPTAALALEAAVRRQGILARRPRCPDVVRLAALQRVVRAQRFAGPLSFSHFTVFGLVSAGRDTGSLTFERRHLLEHLRVAVDGITGLVDAGIRLRLTVLESRLGPCLDAVADAFAGEPRVDVVEDPHRRAGRAYYGGLCFTILVDAGSGYVEVGDGGFVPWTQTLLADRKERLLISGVGIDRLATLPAGREVLRPGR